MRKTVYSFLSVALCFSVCGSLFAQPRMLPGQEQRQSLSGGRIYRCLFDALSDAEDRDGRPDHWERKRGIEGGIPFPDHLFIGIDQVPNPFSNFVLRMNMEGGAAAMFSPKIPIRKGMSYTVSAFAETIDLVFNDVYVVAAFYEDDSTQPIRTIESNKIRNTNGWQKLVVGPIPADMPNVKFIAVGLVVMPSTRQDFGARVHFTNVEIRESPVVTLEMANDNHLFSTTRELYVRCHFRGLDPAQHSVLFVIEDHSGRVYGQREVDLMIGNFPAARFVITPQNALDVLHGIATWENLPIQSFGFYRIRVATPEPYIQSLRLPADQVFDDPLRNIEPLTFAVMPPGSFHPGGEFGWTLDDWTHEEIIKTLPTLAQSGLSHLKLPVWLSPNATPQERDALRRLCNTLSQQQVHLIGLLKPVPESILSKIRFEQVNAASILGTDIQLWGNSLQPALRSLSLLVKDWQWTSDSDCSLIDLFFEPGGKMTSSGMDRLRAFHKLFDQDQFGFGVGLTWNWYQDVPGSEFPFQNFSLNFPIDASVTPEMATTALADMSASPFRRRVSIAPLPADDYSLDTRIINFVQNLVLMKTVAGVDTISLTAPKDKQTGILRQDGTPGELYLPWRTTAMFLSGSRFLGSITLPNRSRNFCFDAGGGRCVMVVWNEGATLDNPVFETLYLGNEPVIYNVWGKYTLPEQQGTEQTIAVTQTPVFVTGLNLDVARFRLSLQTHVNAISAVPNRVHNIPFSYRNDSTSPVSLKITPQGPRAKDWTITPPSLTANLEAGLAGEGSFDLTLLPPADTGRRLFQYNVRLAGTEPVEFAVYDEMMIGNPDVFMEFTTQLNEKGEIEVIQVFVNNSDEVYTYECRLTIPQRGWQKSRITRQGFGRSEEYVYIIRGGQELINSGVSEMVLRAVPVNTGNGASGEPMVYTIPLPSSVGNEQHSWRESQNTYHLGSASIVPTISEHDPSI